jgi:hypothetical protein
MGRTSNIGALHYNAFDWSQDAMVISFATTKTDKKGERTEETAKHVYANPIMPQICPVLSLAVYIFSSRHHPEGFLFENASVAKDRFLNIFSSIISTLMMTAPYLQAVLNEIASHSNRKVQVMQLIYIIFIL